MIFGHTTPTRVGLVNARVISVPRARRGRTRGRTRGRRRAEVEPRARVRDASRWACTRSRTFAPVTDDAMTTVTYDGGDAADIADVAVVGARRALLGSYLNSDPNNQVYVFMFAFSLILFSVPPLLRLKRFLGFKAEEEPEMWDFEQEMPDLAPGGGRAARPAQD